MSFKQHIISPVLPETIPVLWPPKLEHGFTDKDNEYAYVLHALVDRDYAGQYAYFQVAKRPVEANASFGDWHYGFYYRGGDSSWEEWQLDLVFGIYMPTYERFGRYVDACEES